MGFFQAPPHTQYDLRFSVAGIPVRVHPLFWLITLLFGASSRDPIRIVIWVVVVFISILVHELGHSFAFRLFGQDSRIVLYGMGGLAIPDSPWGGNWSTVSQERQQRIIISLAGPIAGFTLAGVVLLIVIALGGTVGVSTIAGILPVPAAYLPLGGSIGNAIIGTFLWVNIFWGLINLLPVFPLDGGRVSQQIMLAIDPVNGSRTALWISVVAGALIAVAAVWFLSSIYMAFLFGYLAFQSYTMIQGTSGRLF